MTDSIDNRMSSRQLQLTLAIVKSDRNRDPRPCDDESSSGGRPSKRTPEIEATILRALGLGLSFEVAAGIAGVHRRTIERWREADEEFGLLCQQAVAQGKLRMAAKLCDLAEAGNITALIFWLKTRTEEFREKAEVAIELDPEKMDARYL